MIPMFGLNEAGVACRAPHLCAMEARATLVLGASLKPEHYSHLAMLRLQAHGHPVVAVGLREGAVAGIPVRREIPIGTRVHTVTLYLNARNQEPWADRILALRPRRIIFNPGAENADLARRAREAGIETLEACTLVMLSTGQF